MFQYILNTVQNVLDFNKCSLFYILMILLVNGKIRHRKVQMIGKELRDMVSDKVNL